MKREKVIVQCDICSLSTRLDPIDIYNNKQRGWLKIRAVTNVPNPLLRDVDVCPSCVSIIVVANGLGLTDTITDACEDERYNYCSDVFSVVQGE